MAKSSANALSKKETVNDTKDISRYISRRTWADMISPQALIDYPSKDQWRQQFIATFLEWAQKDDSVEIQDFTQMMKMRRQTLYEWADKYPDLKVAFDEVKLIIGSRRRKGALYKKFSETMVLKDLHRYDPEWHEVNKYHKDMGTDDKNVPTTFNIVIDKPKVVTPEELKGEVDAIE